MAMRLLEASGLAVVVVAILGVQSPARAQRSFDERHAEVMRCIGEAPQKIEPSAGVAACTTAIAEMTVDGARTRFYRNRGAWYMELKNYTAAEADYVEVMRRAPNDDDTLLQLANARSFGKNFPGAAETARTLTQHKPELAQAWLILFDAEYSLGHTVVALAAGDRALALTPTDPLLLKYTCAIRVETGIQIDVALDRCDGWVRRSSTPEALTYRAGARLLTKNYVGAIADYDAANRAKPSGLAQYARGYAKLFVGREAEGRADMAAGARLEPGVVAIFAKLPPPPSLPTVVTAVSVPPSAQPRPVAFAPLTPSQITDCTNEAIAAQRRAQSGPGDFQMRTGNMALYQKNLFTHQCAGHPDAARYIANADSMIAMTKIAQPLPAVTAPAMSATPTAVKSPKIYDTPQQYVAAIERGEAPLPPGMAIRNGTLINAGSATAATAAPVGGEAVSAGGLRCLLPQNRGGQHLRGAFVWEGTAEFDRYDYTLVNRCSTAIWAMPTYGGQLGISIYLEAAATQNWFCTVHFYGNRDCPGGTVDWVGKNAK